MNRKTAFQILQLPSTASHDDIRQQYQKLYTAFQAKITHAPNAVLKERFEHNFAQIQIAYQALQEVPSSDEFLPSIEPIASGETPLVSTNAPKSSEETTQPSTTAKANADANKKPILVAIFAVATAALFIILWFGLRKEVARLSPLEEELTAYKNLFQNSPFVIENASNSAFVLAYYQLFYLDEDNEIKEKEGAPAIEIASSRSFSSFKEIQGQKEIFDGQALFYTIVLEPTQEGCAKIFSGIIGKEKSIAINPDFTCPD